jgi:hypothetical protein
VPLDFPEVVPRAQERYFADLFEELGYRVQLVRTVMTNDLDLLEDVPPFPAYVLPPGVFPGFSAVTTGGSMIGNEGVAMVEYLYRPDYDLQGPMVAVSSTRPMDGNELHHESPMWWASDTVRVDETLMGDFPMNAGVVARWEPGTKGRRGPRSKAIPANCSDGRRFPSTRSRTPFP